MKHDEQTARPGKPEGPAQAGRGAASGAGDPPRELVRAGDREAFAQLYDAHAKAVYNHAHRLTGDWSAAEEVMSVTFLVAWRTRERVDEGTDSLRPWLLGIATNKARNHRRGVGRRLAFLARQARPADEADFADASAARVDGVRELAAVQAAWGRLRQQEREVLALRVYGGLDYAQTAVALGVPVGTVRSRLARARARLRDLVDRQLAADGTEPDRRRGEVGGRAAFAVLPVERKAR